MGPIGVIGTFPLLVPALNSLTITSREAELPGQIAEAQKTKQAIHGHKPTHLGEVGRQKAYLADAIACMRL